MQYKSLLTYAEGHDPWEDRVRAAAGLARQWNAHLTVIALGFEPNIPAYAYPDAVTGVASEFYAYAKKQAEETAAKVSEVLRKEGVLHDVKATTSLVAGVAARFGGFAQFADLVIASPPLASRDRQSDADFVEGALFDGDATTLICTPTMPDPFAKRIMIGWNGSREALRAVRRAMPLLERAEQIDIVIVDAEHDDQTEGADVALMLSRHGLKVDIATIDTKGDRISDALAHHAADRNSDLLVLGAYSHSRFREYVLGGVTRDILKDIGIPALMAH